VKNTLNIYTNFPHKNFLKSTLSNFKLDFKKLEDATARNSERNKVLFILPQESNKLLIKKYLQLKNVLFIIPQNIVNLIDINNNSILIYPTTIEKFKSKISQIFVLRKEIFGECEINDQKIINKKNNKFCFLTNLEKEIFIELMHKPIISRKFLEENILNINPKAETHSLDSHLSRIRKKLQLIDSKFKIISKDNDITLQS